VLLSDQMSTDFCVEGAYVESIPHCDTFAFEGIITRGGPMIVVPPRPPVSTQPPTVPPEAPSRPPAALPERPTAPSATPALVPSVQVTVTFTFRGWKRIA